MLAVRRLLGEVCAHGSHRRINGDHWSPKDSNLLVSWVGKLSLPEGK